MNSEEHAEVIVVGLGAVGSATLYQLARSGVRAIGVDRFRPPHDQGSSHGETRITRLGIGEGEAYVPLAVRSHAIWRELEAETGSTPLLACGFALIDSSGGSAIMHGKAAFAERTFAAARKFGIAHERLTAADLASRFPAFVPRGDEQIYFEPEGGLVYPERCISAQLDCARALGAVVRVDEPVRDVRPHASGVSVVTDRTCLHADRVIVAAGGWTPALAGGPFAGLRLLRQVLHWIEPTDPELFSPGRFPSFIWTHGPRAADTFYGFPIVSGGTAGVKMATEQDAVALDRPGALERRVDPAEFTALLKDHVHGRVGGLFDRAVRSEACFYTSAKDGDFVIGHAPDSDRVLVASACSGHGFKHSAALGEHLARVSGGIDPLTAQFSADRLSP